MRSSRTGGNKLTRTYWESRIREAYDRTHHTDYALAHSIKISAGVVTAGCPKAGIARRCGRVLVPRVVPRRPARPAGSVTVSSRACLGRTRAEPLCVELRSPARAGGATNWAFCAVTGGASDDRGAQPRHRRDRRGAHALLLLYCAGGGQPGHVRPRIRYGPYHPRARHCVQGGPVR
jgi:hypothetical protein